MHDPAPEPNPCPICRVHETELEFPDATGPAREFPLVRCRRCGLVFQRDARTPEHRDEAQRTAYGGARRRFERPLEWAIRLFRRSRLRRVRPLLPAHGSTLDIGCGRGLYLRMLQERGYRVRGTELSTRTARNAHPEVTVDVGEMEPGRYPDASFDLITLWHVLEHLPRPDRTLEACRRALKPGGAILIALPNYGSLQARLGGERWFHLDLPRHLSHFTEATLRRLVTERGLEVESCRTGQWEMDPFGLLQTLLNRMHLPHNALYDSLRSNEEARSHIGWPLRLLLLALLPFGILAALPLSLFARCIGRAGTLVLVARPRMDGALRT